jgi:hypothetical protein
VIFDDFHYSSHSDPALQAHGWNARDEAGGPGVPGASWRASNITFPTSNGDQVAQLAASTDGTSTGTVHAELRQTQQRVREGTYATRVRFSDVPVSGADGDHINQTAFTITPLRYDYDPLYSELDFSEYLPNGGWGETGPVNFHTSWYTYRAEPWDSWRAYTALYQSYAGWHTIVTQVADGHVKYYVDGVLTADHTVDQHGNPVTPRQDMTMNYNLWFIDLATHSGGTSTYQEQVDWAYYAKNEVVSPSDAAARAATYRTGGTTFLDTLVAGGTCESSPPTTPPTNPPADCTTAPAWNWGTVYLEGQRAKHVNKLWQARWWTQGSEPGLTAQWAEVGPCT